MRPDAEGRPRGIVRRIEGRPTLPAGSIVLTGTPAGTAIEAPGGADRLRLFLLGNLSPTKARQRYAHHAAEHAREFGFLGPGDRVETMAHHLGHQSWEIVP